MDALKVLLQTQQGQRVLRQIVDEVKRGKLRIQSDIHLQERVKCRASFYTDGVCGTIFLDPRLEGYSGALIIFHEFIHALDQSYRKVRFQEKQQGRSISLKQAEFEAEKRAYRAVYDFIQELKEKDRFFCEYLIQKKCAGLNIDRLFTDQEIAEAHHLECAIEGRCL